MNSKQRINICLVTRFFSLRNGGIGRFSIEVLNGLKKSGYDIVPVSTERNGSIGHVIYSTIDLARKLPRNCDVYHCLTPMEAFYAPKKSAVVTFHDLIPWLYINRTDTHYVQGPTRRVRSLLSKYYFKTAAAIAARCELIACHSEQTRQELINYLHVDESRTSIIRYGISRDLRPGPKKDSRLRFGTLSYLDPRKRIDRLIRDFLSAGIDGELVIGGAGSDYARLKKLAGEDQRIKFAGFVPDEGQADFYNSLDYFIFPSKIEGYGLPIVEALACKKPVVVLEDAIMPEEVREHCTVVEDLAGFFRDPNITADVEAGYRFAMLHDWDKCVADYIRLYERILAQK